MDYDFIIDDIIFNINGIGSHAKYWDSEIVMMKASDFLQIATNLEKPRKSISFLKEKMGTEAIAAPLLSFYSGNFYKVTDHEGRHRATLCLENGMEYIPVALHNATEKDLTNGFISQRNEWVHPEFKTLDEFLNSNTFKI